MPSPSSVRSTSVGRIPRANISAAALKPWSKVSKARAEKTWASGRRNTRIVALVITPNTPSEPMNRCFRLGPDDWLGTALVPMIRPSANTASKATTWSPMGP